jgi:hypothetical protein
MRLTNSGCLARREDKNCDNRECGGKKEGEFPVPQNGSPELLTVIHNPAQALFFPEIPGEHN